MMLSILLFCGAVLAKNPTVIVHAPYAQGPDETPTMKWTYFPATGSNSGDVLGGLRVGDYIDRETMDECQFDACSYTGVLFGDVRGRFTADLCPDGKISHVVFSREHKNDYGSMIVGLTMDEGWKWDLQDEPESFKDGSTRGQYVRITKGTFERTVGSVWNRKYQFAVDWVSTNEINCEHE